MFVDAPIKSFGHFFHFCHFIFLMNVIYLVGEHATFPRVVAQGVRISGVIKSTFEECSTVVWTVMFTKLRSVTALRDICSACPLTRVVAARRPIFAGLTPTGTVMWKVEIASSPDVLFSGRSELPAVWEAAVPQPVYRELHLPNFHANEEKEEEEVIDSGQVQIFAPLRVGEHIAYLLPMIPVEEQTRFITTKITGLGEGKECVELENGHHTTMLASGNIHVARYCPTTNRIEFPFRNLNDFRIK